MRRRKYLTFETLYPDSSWSFSLSRYGWLICILQSLIKTLRLLVKICFPRNKVNVSYFVEIVHRKRASELHFSGFGIWTEIFSKKGKQQGNWWNFYPQFELPAPHTQNVFAYEIEQHNKIEQILRLFIVGLGGTYYPSVMVQPRKLLHSGTV